MDEMRRVLLVDTTGFVFRAFHALKDTAEMTRADGVPTGAIYVTVNMLMRVLQKHRGDGDGVACVMDAPGKTFRHDMYPAYKANRPPPDPALVGQFPPLKAFIKAMGLKLACVQEVEADDVIATLHAQARAKGMHVTISSGDKDLMQLVDGETSVVDNLRSEERRYGPDEVREKYGVPPGRVVDLLALTGDSSDNIRGVDKVGPKTAAKWIARYGSFEEIAAHAHEITGKVGENLRAAIPQVRENLGLVTVRKDVDLGFGLEDLRPDEPDEAELHRLCEEYQFRFEKRILQALRGTQAAAAQSAAPAAERIKDAAGLASWIGKHAGQRLGIHASYRKKGESPLDDEWESIALAGTDARCWMGLGDDVRKTRAALAAIGESGAAFVTGDAKRLTNALRLHELPIPARLDDVALLSFVEQSQQNSSLTALSRRLLDASPPDFAGEAGPEEAAWNAAVAVQAHDALRKNLSAEELGVYEQIDLPLVPVLARMERTGVLIDADELDAFAQELAQRMERAEQEVFGLAGREFNLGSPVQVAEVLFDELGLPPLRKTQKGARSTDESVLGELAARADLPEEGRRIVGLILEHRSCGKLRSTYALRLPEWIHPETKRVHTHFTQTEAVTGRLASSRPNLQNIPVRSGDGRRIRRAFIAPDQHVLLSADYSQIELRLMAHMSGDRTLVASFNAGEDVHRSTAAEIFGVLPDAVNADQRRFAKSINFGLIYGMSEYGLSKQLGIDVADARQHIGSYFDRYPGVREFMDGLRVASESERHVKTLCGRRIHSQRARGHMARQAAQRAAINAPLQGTAADLIKKAMAEVDAWLARERMRSRLLLQVHDELLLEVPDGELDAVRERIAEIMSGVASLNVPLVADVSCGSNWDEAH